MPDNYGTWVSLSQLASHDSFEQLIVATRLRCQLNNNQTWVDVSNLQAEVDSQKSYLQRKEEIESKGADSKNKLLRRIHHLRLSIRTLRMTKLNELLRLDADHMDELFKGFEENGELARFLILEGHLDDTYYQYTSLFHSGRLSPNDNRFLIQIRAFVTPEPNFPLDNPKEVIAAMRDEDFRQGYVLNVKLVDNLLADGSLYLDHVQKLFELLSSEFESCEDFFSAYYTSGLDVSVLLLGLVNAWKNFVPAAIASSNNISHVTQLIAHLPVSLLKTLATDFHELSEFVAANLPEILLHSPELTPERLKCLDFEVKDLAAIKEHSEIVRFMFEEGLYGLTITNLEHVYQEILGQSDLKSMRARNFTTLRATNNAILMKRVERDFSLYLRDILLGQQENSEEDIPAILAILSHDTLDQDDLRKFLERQTARLPTLEGVSEKLHATLFQLNAIEATWMNCLAFIESKGFEENSLTGYLDLDVVREAILQHPIPSDSESLKLRLFLLNAGSISDAAYKDYAHALPNEFTNLPQELEPHKLRILISEGKITFTKEIFDALAANKDLQVLLIASNIDKYLTDPNSFELDDDFRDELLRSDIENAAKLGVVSLMDLEALTDLPERSALIGPIIKSADANISGIGVSSAQSLIINSRQTETQISLFNKYHLFMSDDEVRHVLANLPQPFSKIKTGYASPRLKNTPENRDLVQWLDSRNIISSWSDDHRFTDEIKVNLYRH